MTSFRFEHGFLNSSPLEKRADAPHHFASLLAVPNNAFGGLVCLGHPRRLGRKKSQTGVTARYHRR